MPSTTEVTMVQQLWNGPAYVDIRRGVEALLPLCGFSCVERGSQSVWKRPHPAGSRWIVVNGGYGAGVTGVGAWVFDQPKQPLPGFYQNRPGYHGYLDLTTIAGWATLVALLAPTQSMKDLNDAIDRVGQATDLMTHAFEGLTVQELNNP